MTLLLALFGLSLAHAAEPADARTGRVTAYPIHDGLTVGLIENFRELFVDAETFPATLKPVEPAAVARTDALPIANDTSSWAEVTINGQRIGIIEPFTHGAVHGVLAGDYDITLTLQNGYREQRRVGTLTVTGPGDEPPAEVPAGG